MTSEIIFISTLREEVFQEEGNGTRYQILLRGSTICAPKCLYVGLDLVVHESLANSVRFCWWEQGKSSHFADQPPKPDEATCAQGILVVLFHREYNLGFLAPVSAEHSRLGPG